MKPRIFIGSSSEAKDVADAIHAELDDYAECTVWTQAVFSLATTAVQSLMDRIRASDFAIFVFAPDDKANVRGTLFPVPRDNVIYELGLFSGALGPDRCFFLTPQGSDVHLPTDLLGITAGRYNANRTDRNLRAAVGPFCGQVRDKLRIFRLATKAIPAQPGTGRPSPEEHVAALETASGEGTAWAQRRAEEQRRAAKTQRQAGEQRQVLPNKDLPPHQQWTTGMWREAIKAVVRHGAQPYEDLDDIVTAGWLLGQKRAELQGRSFQPSVHPQYPLMVLTWWSWKPSFSMPAWSKISEKRWELVRGIHNIVDGESMDGFRYMIPHDNARIQRLMSLIPDNLLIASIDTLYELIERDEGHSVTEVLKW